MPPRQRIRCFECGYEFNLTGRMHSTYCPKCRTTLDLAGYTIDSDCAEPLKTLGTVVVTKRGIVNSTRIVANDIELHGKIKKSPSQAFGALIVHPGAEFARKDIDASDLRLAEGAEIAFKAPATYRDVEVAGKLECELYATGVVTIRAGGVFEGTIHARHLVVEDGGILLGEMNISDEGLDVARKKREEFREGPPSELEKEKIKVPALPEPEEEEEPPAAPPRQQPGS